MRTMGATTPLLADRNSAYSDPFCCVKFLPPVMHARLPPQAACRRCPCRWLPGLSTCSSQTRCGCSSPACRRGPPAYPAVAPTHLAVPRKHQHSRARSLFFPRLPQAHRKLQAAKADADASASAVALAASATAAAPPPGPLAVARDIYATSGLLGFWKGVLPVRSRVTTRKRSAAVFSHRLSDSWPG